jgi:DNA-binding NarL/FixJ family response regulator
MHTGISNSIRVVIADDHEITRIGVRRLLSIAPDIEVIAEASSGQQTIELTRALRPSVVLVDVVMPGVSGIEAVQRIKAESPETCVVMLSSWEDKKSIERAMFAGADGYLSKEVNSAELIGAIRQVINGERVFSKSILRLLEGNAEPQESEGQPTVALTKREEEIVVLVAKGLTSQAIAEKLFISPRTVETHRARIMDKLGVNNSAGLVRFALLHSAYFRTRTKIDF